MFTEALLYERPFPPQAELRYCNVDGVDMRVHFDPATAALISTHTPLYMGEGGGWVVNISQRSQQSPAM